MVEWRDTAINAWRTSDSATNFGKQNVRVRE